MYESFDVGRAAEPRSLRLRPFLTALGALTPVAVLVFMLVR